MSAQVLDQTAVSTTQDWADYAWFSADIHHFDQLFFLPLRFLRALSSMIYKQQHLRHPMQR